MVLLFARCLAYYGVLLLSAVGQILFLFSCVDP